MDKTEYLLVKLMEECAEVSQRAAKILTFGKDEIQENPEQNPKRLTNEQRLNDEFNDLIAITDMLEQVGINFSIYNEKLFAKKGKVAKYMDYSRQKGCLD